MPTITNITQQKRRKDRFSVYVDSAYRLSLSQDQLVDAALRIGDELTEDRIAELMQQSEAGKALDQAYNFLSYRTRSRQELVQYFRRKRYDDELAALLIQRLEEQDLVNDQRFAREWVESRQLTSPRSVVQLRAELREKGIAADAVDEALALLDTASEVEALVALIERRRLQQRYADTKKLTHYLAGKGFRFDAIRAALERLETA